MCSYSECPLPRCEGYSPLPLHWPSFSRRTMGKSPCALVPKRESIIPLANSYLFKEDFQHWRLLFIRHFKWNFLLSLCLFYSNQLWPKYERVCRNILTKKFCFYSYMHICIHCSYSWLAYMNIILHNILQSTRCSSID